MDLVEVGELILLLFRQITKHLDRGRTMPRVMVVGERKNFQDLCVVHQRLEYIQFLRAS